VGAVPEGAMASEMVCQGSPPVAVNVGGVVAVLLAEAAVVEARRDGEAERVGVAVPIGAKLEGWDEDE